MDDLAAFAEWLLQAGLNPSTVKNYLSAVKGMYLLWDNKRVIEIFESFAWSLTLRALPHAVRPILGTRTSITPEHLLLLVRACGERSFWPLRVALVFGFLGYLRVSNLAPNTLSDFDDTRHTTWNDVTDGEGGIMLTLKWTKTRQAITEGAPIPLPLIRDSELCPVLTWREYTLRLADIPVSSNSPLLLTTSDPRGRVITVPALRGLLRRAAEVAGLSHCNYTPHSLRRGGASFSFRAGVPLDQIKHHGTWRSSAVDRYLLSTPKFDTPVAQAFANHFAGIN